MKNASCLSSLCCPFITGSRSVRWLRRFQWLHIYCFDVFTTTAICCVRACVRLYKWRSEHLTFITVKMSPNGENMLSRLFLLCTRLEKKWELPCYLPVHRQCFFGEPLEAANNRWRSTTNSSLFVIDFENGPGSGENDVSIILQSSSFRRRCRYARLSQVVGPNKGCQERAPQVPCLWLEPTFYFVRWN